MKALALVAALFVSVSAQAQSIHSETELRETLTNVHVDGEKTGLTGVLTVDFIENKIRVDLYNDICGALVPAEPGQLKCKAAAILEHTIEVPLQNRTIACGSTIYSGTEDLTMVDGFRTTIQVADHGKRVCKDLVPSRYMVKATQFAPRVNKTTTYLLFK